MLSLVERKEMRIKKWRVRFCIMKTVKRLELERLKSEDFDGILTAMPLRHKKRFLTELERITHALHIWQKKQK